MSETTNNTAANPGGITSQPQPEALPVQSTRWSPEKPSRPPGFSRRQTTPTRLPGTPQTTIPMLRARAKVPTL